MKLKLTLTFHDEKNCNFTSAELSEILDNVVGAIVHEAKTGSGVAPENHETFLAGVRIEDKYYFAQDDTL